MAAQGEDVRSVNWLEVGIAVKGSVDPTPAQIIGRSVAIDDIEVLFMLTELVAMCLPKLNTVRGCENDVLLTKPGCLQRRNPNEKAPGLPQDL